jgi:cell division protein ZapE
MNDPAPGAGEPMALYRERLNAGLLQPDPAQQFAVERLQRLSRALLHYRREGGAHSWLRHLALFEANGGPAPTGLYLHGPVGRGKSMLMDLFFAAAPVAKKRRVHFHAFMLEVHDRIDRENRAKTADPLKKVAHDIAADAILFCFDEFLVEDIADAMILERLFTGLFEAGVVVVATANRAPDRLYEHGLHRDRFLPFIALLQQRLEVLALDSGRDWRLTRMLGKKVYHRPLGPEATQALAEAFAELTDRAAPAPATLIVKGRALPVPRAARNVAWFDFAELCEGPRAAADYLAIAEHYAAVLIDGIPRLSPQQRNAAKRFTTLIDALYEARTLLVAAADGAPEDLYPEGDGSFEFRRTASRLVEMQTQDYIANRPRG